MKNFATLAAFAASAHALVPRNSGCCFHITASGDISGTVGQISDGQNRIGGGLPPAEFCIDTASGTITDSNGRGCIVTEATTQFQCDLNGTPTPGFSINSNGRVVFNGDMDFVACETGQAGGLNIYTTESSAVTKCRDVQLNVDSCLGTTSGSSSVPVSPSSSAPVPSSSAPVPSSSAPVPSSSVPFVPGQGSSTPIPSQCTAMTTTVYTTVTVPCGTISGTPVPIPGESGTPGLSPSETPGAPGGQPQPSETPGVSGGQPQTQPSETPSSPGGPGGQPSGAPTQPGESCPSGQPQPSETAGAPSGQPQPSETTGAPSGQPQPSETTGAPSGQPQPSGTTGAPGGQPQPSGTPGAPGGQPSGNPSSPGGPGGQPSSTPTRPRATPSSPGAPGSQPSSTPTRPQATPSSPGAPGGQPSSTSTQPGASCPTDLSGNYEFPHLIVPIDSASPDTAAGTSLNGTVSSTVSTIFNFDIPSSDAGKTCSLVFLFPKQEDLETSAFSFSGDGMVQIGSVESPATQSTTFNNAPAIKQDYGEFTISPGNSYLISTFKCPAGQTVGYEMTNAGSTELNFFQDFNPSPIGMYITVC